MSESWMQLITTIVLGWGAWEIRALRGEFKRYVLREDCKINMGNHCSQIEQLQKDIAENREHLAKLEGKVRVWHNENYND